MHADPGDAYAPALFAPPMLVGGSADLTTHTIATSINNVSTFSLPRISAPHTGAFDGVPFPTNFAWTSFTVAAPTTTSIIPGVIGDEPTLAVDADSVVYVSLGSDSQDRVCTYQYTLLNNYPDPYSRSDFVVYIRLPPPTPATNVPIFTPIGLAVTIGGLLWFGRRRKAMKVTSG